MTNLSRLLQSPDFETLSRHAPNYVVSDWLRDHGEDVAASEFGVATPWKWLDVWRFLGSAGIGSGYGRGIGSGSGSGRGRGRGIGIGSGRGIGIGSGSGSNAVLTRRDILRVGQSYLLHLGDWHTVIGRVAEQLGPLTYELELASKCDMESLGDRWNELAAGDKDVRAATRYWHFAGMLVVPLSIMAMEWHGDLPHPDFVK